MSAGARPWKAAVAWAAGCSIAFIAVYGSCAALAMRRPELPTLAFGWETRIPFVPAMIVPYWSIDLLFVAAFFLCASRAEVGLLGRRLLLATAGAGLWFAAFPLELVFPRPEVKGVWEPFFATLRGFDPPTNLFPSLHVAYRTLLVDTYARHTRGPARILVHVWFSLVGFSTVLTYQHQVLDVIGGFGLALVCFYLVRNGGERIAFRPGRGIGALYASGAALLGTAALVLPPWGVVLLWPALSCALVSAAYFGLGSAVFGKSGGRVPLATRVLLAPCLLGQWISFVHYRRRVRPWDEVCPGVWIGRRLDSPEAEEARRLGVTAVLDLTAEFSAPTAFLDVTYRNVPLPDLSAPELSELQKAVDFVAERAASGIVYVHCKAGYSRSAAVVGAFLIASGKARDADEAVAILRRVRPSLVVRREAMNVLGEFQR